jgi:hypothetical protein
MYLANPCGPDVTAAMQAGTLGYIDTPAQGNKRPAGVVWCADNGCFSDKWDQEKWWQFLVDNAHDAATCLFAVAPDVVGDAYATTVRFRKWWQRIRALGYPVAYVAQDGLEKLRGNTVGGGLTFPVPWDSFDVLFIGGSTNWKLGEAARGIVAEAKGRGKWVHMGRVNSQRRFEYARAIGCDSADGTYLTFGPDTNLPKLLAWTRLNNQPGLWETP